MPPYPKSQKKEVQVSGLTHKAPEGVRGTFEEAYGLDNMALHDSLCQFTAGFSVWSVNNQNRKVQGSIEVAGGM